MEKTGLPVSQDMFLEAGVHIGTRIKTNDMKQFIFKKRDDGLYILDLTKTAERIMAAAKLLSKYQPKDILIVASRIYSSNAAAKFSKLTGIPVLQGRFVPGTMTNLASKQFQEPKLVFVCDPKGEKEAIMESAKNGVPVIALCDTDNETKFIDLIVPINNKGRRSLALLFYILAREVLLSQGVITSYDQFKYDLNFFERLEETKPSEEEAEPSDEEAAEKEAEETAKEEAKETTKKEESKQVEQKPERAEEKSEKVKSEAKSESQEESASAQESVSAPQKVQKERTKKIKGKPKQEAKKSESKSES